MLSLLGGVGHVFPNDTAQCNVVLYCYIYACVFCVLDTQRLVCYKLHEDTDGQLDLYV